MSRIEDAGERARRLIAHLDLTRLTPGEPAAPVAALCRRAADAPVPPAAVCVRPEHVETARSTLAAFGLGRTVRVATVANFPGGDRPVAEVESTIAASLDQGADEIDVVLPWRAMLDGDVAATATLLGRARRVCGRAVMKVILETGALDEATIDRAADLALDHGADFLKTSTGMGPPGASPAAAARLLERIDLRGAACGLKVSGGVRRFEDADAYLRLAERRMGAAWPTPQRFRIGASGLLDDLLARIGR